MTRKLSGIVWFGDEMHVEIEIDESALQEERYPIVTGRSTDGHVKPISSDFRLSSITTFYGIAVDW